jgi:lysophospholipase L1-like esterase
VEFHGHGGPDESQRHQGDLLLHHADILRINAWMRNYAAKIGAIYADYFTPLADGLHPNAAGYELMAPVAAAAIQKALP